MTEPETFVIRRAFVVPLGLLILLTLALMLVCILQDQPVAKVVILGGLMLPLMILFIESAGRRIVIDDEGVTAVRPLRSKRIEFAAVTSFEAVQVRSRVFLTLSAGEDEFLIISNSYGSFPALVRALVARVPAGTLAEEAETIVSAPAIRQADVVTAWLAVGVMIYVLAAQFLR